MQQQLQLPGLAQPCEVPGATDWMSGPPPMVGWWLTRTVFNGTPGPAVMRLWRGGPKMPGAAASGFSRWSTVPLSHMQRPSELLHYCRTAPSYVDEDTVQWAGLQVPPPEGCYPYRLNRDLWQRKRVHLLPQGRERVRVHVE